MKVSDLPYDLLPPILAQISDRLDYYHVALVSKTWNRAASPYLYESLDSRVSEGTGKLLHPATTILQRPELAQYVRHVTETGNVHGAMLRDRYPTITSDTLRVLELCKNIRSVTWINESETSAHQVLLAMLAIISQVQLWSLTIRTHNDLGEPVWEKLRKLTGLRYVSVWSMQGPPRVLQGWAEHLGSTLTTLELGRCSGVPPTVLVSVVMQLPKLVALRLKGAPAASIPSMLMYLPKLEKLDTGYLSGNYRRPNGQLPKLRKFTVRTSSMDAYASNLWNWSLELLSHPTLDTFALHAYSIHGNISMPRQFIISLASVQSQTLRRFELGTTELTLEDIEYLCDRFPKLEVLVCSVASPDLNAIIRAIRAAQNLTTLRLQITWIPFVTVVRQKDLPFTIEDATRMMLRDDNSKLRVIGLGSSVYTGKWVLDAHGQLQFNVRMDIGVDKWNS